MAKPSRVIWVSITNVKRNCSRSTKSSRVDMQMSLEDIICCTSCTLATTLTSTTIWPTCHLPKRRLRVLRMPFLFVLPLHKETITSYSSSIWIVLGWEPISWTCSSLENESLLWPLCAKRGSSSWYIIWVVTDEQLVTAPI